MLEFTIITLVSILGMSYLYRMHGGAKPHLPWKVNEILIALALTAPLLLATSNLYVLVLGFLGTAILKTKGHGQYMTLNFTERFLKPIKQEDWDIFIDPVMSDDPRTLGLTTSKSFLRTLVEGYGVKRLYKRCLLGLSLSGGSVGLPLAICYLYLGLDLQALLMIVLLGAGKPLSYALGWKLIPNGQVNKGEGFFGEATKIGELGSGAFAGLALAACILLAL